MEGLVNLIRVEKRLGQRRAEKQPGPNSIGNSQPVQLQPWLPFLGSSE